LIYLAFGNMDNSSGSGAGFNLPAVKVIAANLDQADPQFNWSASQMLIEYLQSQEVAGMMSVTVASDEAGARRSIQQRKADVAVIIQRASHPLRLTLKRPLRFCWSTSQPSKLAQRLSGP